MSVFLFPLFVPLLIPFGFVSPPLLLLHMFVNSEPQKIDSVQTCPLIIFLIWIYQELINSAHFHGHIEQWHN